MLCLRTTLSESVRVFFFFAGDVQTTPTVLNKIYDVCEMKKVHEVSKILACYFLCFFSRGYTWAIRSGNFTPTYTIALTAAHAWLESPLSSNLQLH